MKFDLKIFPSVLLFYLFFLNVTVLGEKNPDSLFSKRQEIARQIQEINAEGKGIRANTSAGKLNYELLRIDSLLLYNYLLNYARKNQNLETAVKKITSENTVLKSNLYIHRNLIIGREKTLKYLLGAILFLIIALSLFISLYIERLSRIRKLNLQFQKSASDLKAAIDMIEEKNTHIENLEKNEIIIKESIALLEKEYDSQISNLKTENQNLTKRFDDQSKTITHELLDLLQKLKTKK